MKLRALRLTAIAHGLRSLWNAALYPRVSLDFLSGALDSRVTFSRGTNATLIGSNGSLQYAPHNLLTYSEQFDNAYWTVTAATVTPNSVEAPNGTQTADQLVETVGTGTLPRLPIPITLNVGQPYAASVYAKEVPGSSKRYLQVYFNAGFASTPCGANFDLATGTVTYSSGLASTSVENVGNGWWRCTINTTVVTTASTGFRIALVDNPTQLMSLAWNPDGTGSMYVWGAQLNVGALQPYYSTTVKNLLGFTQEFENAAWTKTATNVSSNATQAPDGSQTADKLTETAVTSAFQAYQTVSLTQGTTYRISFYAKAEERNWATTRIGGAVNKNAYFNLATGQTGTADAGFTSFIEAVGNGWYRCSVSYTSAVATGSYVVAIEIASADGVRSYAGVAGNGIYIWGAQLSDSASLDPYVYNPAAAPSNTAYYGPRFDYDPVTLAARGLLIEEQRTNSIRNNTMQGAVAGTPGTLPTNWALGGISGGLATQVVGTGTEAGINYIDIRIFGTNGSGSAIFPGVFFDTITGIAGTTGQIWSAPIYLSLVAGTGILFDTSLHESDSGGVFLRSTTCVGGSGIPNTQSLASQRRAGVATLGASTAFIRPVIAATVGIGASVDFTLRIGLPQLELGAFATSVIPTTTTALTRAADVASMTGANFSSWYNQNEGTLLTTTLAFNQTLGSNRYVSTMDDGTTGNIIAAYIATDLQVAAFVVNGGSAVYQEIISTVSNTSANKISVTYKANNFTSACNGVLGPVDTSGNVPVVNKITFGNRTDGARPLNGYIRSFKYYPTSLSNAELQTLTS